MTTQASTGTGVPPPVIVQHRIPATNDVNVATDRTVELMCKYISTAVADPIVQRAAADAWRRFGTTAKGLSARSLDVLKCWAAFWWVKHAIKFQRDETTMFELGVGDEHDLLINPALLLRAKDPKEDCDGFTMLTAALLSILGVDWRICTVAADGRTPGRWSHVFLVALTPDGPMALDTSHGWKPGWSVPAEHVYRFKAYSPDGRESKLTISDHQLHGYMQVNTGLGSFTDDWLPFIQDISKQGLSIVGSIVAPAYKSSVVDPRTGQVSETIFRNYAGGVPGGQSGPVPAGVGTGSGSMWIWLAVGGIALFALAKK